jgi:hypothetical protein
VVIARQGSGVTWVVLVNESPVEQTATINTPNVRIFDAVGEADGEALTGATRALPGYGVDILAIQDCSEGRSRGPVLQCDRGKSFDA